MQPRKNEIAPAGNRTRVCTVAGYYSTTRPLVLVDVGIHWFHYLTLVPSLRPNFTLQSYGPIAIYDEKDKVK